MHPSEALSPRDAFGSRVVAFLMDLLLICVSAGPLAGGAGWAFALGFSFLYLGVAQGFTGYTLAKALLGARTVRAGTLEAPGIGRGVLRWLLAPLGIPVLTTIFALTNDRRRGLGDRLAGTEVVGMAPDARWRLYAVLAYFVLISAFVAAASLDTFLIVWAIFLPMIIGGLVVVLGGRRLRETTIWLTGLAFAFVGAALMSFQDLCKRGEGRCEDLPAAHKAIPALIALSLAIAAVFLLRGPAARWVVIALTLLGEIWMFLRFRSGQEMVFAAVMLVLFIVAQIAWEVIRLARARDPDADEPSSAAAAASPG
jgi:uncharacterized RDD family membrane protein YckC